MLTILHSPFSITSSFISRHLTAGGAEWRGAWDEEREEAVTALFHLIDDDDDGVIDFREYVVGLVSQQQRATTDIM